MQALEGLKVVEVGNIIAGPFCGTILADFGADVIKVEPPKTGDLIRNMGRIKDMWFAVDGRNKRCVTLNLKSEKGKEMLWDLLKDADILIENFRPGVFERMGFTWEKLHEHNRRLVYVCASGYGRTGPNAHKPGFDRIGLALGGFLEVTGFPGEPPVKPGLSVADFYTGMFGCIGAMFAIYNRDIVGTGEGQMIDCCLTESALRIQESIIAEYNYDGTIRTRIGNGTLVTVPSGHFLTKDGKYLALSVSGDKLFRQWCEAIGRPELADVEEYKTGGGRTAHREEINKICEEWALEHTIQECLDVLGDDIPSSPIYNVADIMKDEHFKFRNDIVEVDTEQFGPIKMQNCTPKMLGTPGQIRWAGAPLGKFNKEVYGERFGYTDEDLTKLKEEGVI